MTVQRISIEALDIAVKMLGYIRIDKCAVVTLKDSSRMTATVHIFNTPEGHVLVNIDKTTTTYDFESQKEFEVSNKFQFFDTEKAMYQDFCGMDDETWEEWNK